MAGLLSTILTSTTVFSWSQHQHNNTPPDTYDANVSNETYRLGIATAHFNRSANCLVGFYRVITQIYWVLLIRGGSKGNG